MTDTEKKFTEGETTMAEEATAPAPEATSPTEEQLLEQINALKAQLEDKQEERIHSEVDEPYIPEKQEDAPIPEDITPLEELKLLCVKEAEQWDYMPKAIGKAKKGKSHTFIKIFLPMLTAFVIVFAILCNSLFGSGWFRNLVTPVESDRKEFTLPIAPLPQLEDNFYQADGRYTVEGVANAVSKSIVTIECYMKGQPLLPYSQGSGVIMSADGYIITNAHVIEDATLSIMVRTSDGAEYDATVIGSDVKSDLAVIKVSSKVELTPAQFGDSDALKLGEQVVAIGSPAGLEGSVTTGIVSGVDRMIKVDANNIEMSCIQIDAAINPGNSGGALLNMWGQVVGITSSKMDSIEFDNIGFAIEMSAASDIIESLIEHGRVIGRPKIGISFYEVSDFVAAENGAPAGLYIAEIDPTCDISNTDLRIDDIITDMNGVPVRSASDVFSVILDLEPGDEVTAKVLRYENGDYTEFEITFKLMEDGGEFIETEADE